MIPEELEKKLSKFTEELEKRFDEFKEQIENRFSSLTSEGEATKIPVPRPKKRHEGAFWGILLIVIGIVLLGNHFRWFFLDIPIIPTALVILGGYLILENRRR